MSIFLMGENIEQLLDAYKRNNDLSQQTIDQNRGHLVLYTREQLERMHAKTLRDIFRIAPVVYYQENRYGLPEPMGDGTLQSYRGNLIRLYIDGVEVTQGWLGSGLLLYGDINIDFADHIEIYYGMPSYATSAEPAYLTIFLYSKDTGRDGGGKVDIVQGSRGYSSQTLSYGDRAKGLSYMVNFSHVNEKREKVQNGTNRPLSRDFKRTQLFSYLKSDTQFAHLQLIEKRSDAFAGVSFDATPLVSKADYHNLHFDYGIHLSENWKAQLSYELLKTDIRQQDDSPLAIAVNPPVTKMYSTIKNSTYNGELTYKKAYGKHHIVTGVKGRLKSLDSYRIEGMGDITPRFDRESIVSLFAQDEYVLDEAKLLSFGMNYSKIFRNGQADNDYHSEVRLGYIFHRNNWSCKSYLYQTMNALTPYASIDRPSPIPMQVTQGTSHETIYTTDHSRTSLSMLFLKNRKNNAAEDEKHFMGIFTYRHNFTPSSVLDMHFYYAHHWGVPVFNTIKEYGSYLGLSSTYEDWDLYNSMVWHHNSIDNNEYFDLNSALSWDVTESLVVTLKGENILNKSMKFNLLRVDPVTKSMLAPISVTPFDRRVTFELEYLF